jgi:ABC-2 type transport system permease protein
MTAVLVHAVARRRRGLLGWSLGLIGVVALVALSYPAIRGNTELDRTFSRLSPGTRALLGLGDGARLTAPTGYLDSQFFANLLPVLLLVFGIGAGAWSIAGDEAAGTLELLLANPVSRTTVAVARFVAVAAMLAGLGVVAAVSLLAARGPAGLDAVGAGHVVAAVGATAALGLAYAAVAFAVGAAGAGRGTAIGVAATAAVVGFALEGVGQAVRPLRPVRAVMPWHWLLDADPLRHGPSWQSLGWPLLLTVVLAAVGVLAFRRRDLR